MLSIYKKILINSIYISLKNTQKNRAKKDSQDIFNGNEKEFIREIYPYALLALQCVFSNDIEFTDAVDFEVLFDETYSLKVKSENEDFNMLDFDNIRPIIKSNNKFNCSETNKLAYSLFLINVMAFYDVGYKKFNFHEIMLKLILLLFGELCTKRLIKSTHNMSEISYHQWEIIKIKRNKLKDLTDIVKFVYGEDTISKELELALFESCNTAWCLSNMNESLDYCFNTLEKVFGYIDISELVNFLSIKKSDETMRLPILKVENVEQSEWSQEGYYNYLYQAFRYGSTMLKEEDRRTKTNLHSIKNTRDFLRRVL